jgi:hypothetical protein
VTLKPGNGVSITPSGSSIDIAFTGGGSSGLTSVTHDATLTGAGTGSSPLAIANGQVVRSVNGLHDGITLAAGSNVTITPGGSTLTFASTGGGLTLPFSGSISSGGSAFDVTNGGTGDAIAGTGTHGNGVHGFSTYIAGVRGESSNSVGVEGRTFFGGSSGVWGDNINGGNGRGVYGTSGTSGYIPTMPSGVWGDSASGLGVLGTSSSQVGVFGHSSSSVAVQGISAGGVGVWGESRGGADGVYGTSVSFNGVEGNVSNSSAGVAGVNHGSGPGIYGENQSGGLAGDFVGDGEYTGSWSKASDARFKKHVAPLEGALQATLMLRGVTFDWRRDEFPERGFREGPDIGFIAQEVETVYPELVSTGTDGYKRVDYSALTPILVEAIKTQQQKIQELEQRLERIESMQR